jgi:hypothetical protein
VNATLPTPAVDDDERAAMIRHVASIIEQATAGGRGERGPAQDGYWAGVDDVTEWWIRHLRESATAITERARRLHRLRQFATRASAGTWFAGDLCGDGQVSIHTGAGTRVGKLTRALDAHFVVAAQPAVILQLLAALDDPDAPAPDLDALTDAARLATRGPWSHAGIFLRSVDGEDLGWMHLQHDVDYLTAVEPAFVLDLIDMLNAARTPVVA